MPFLIGECPMRFGVKPLKTTFPQQWLLCLGLVLLGTFWLMPRSAHAVGQEVCNETSYIVYLATGMPENDTVRTEGWVRLRSGECRVVMPAPFSDKPHYAYGTSSEVHAGGRQQWGGRKAFCVDAGGNFSLIEQDECAALGLQTRYFNLIDVSPPEGGQTVLSEPDNFGERAELAGIQRLLKDNGYNMRAVDGYDGRRTRNAIRKFLADHKISPKPQNPELIDALETTARETLAQTGLTLCNKTSSHLWAAYGRHIGKDWQSRGWWRIAPAVCVPVISGILPDKEIFIYAGLEEDNKERPLTAANAEFCVLEVMFAIHDRGKCQQRGYEKRAFALYRNASGKGLTIELESEDFAKTDVLAGLRR